MLELSETLNSILDQLNRSVLSRTSIIVLIKKEQIG